MSLRASLLITLAIVFVVYLGVDRAVQQWILLPAFVNLEESKARDDMARCVDALRREIHHLDLFIRDWAVWDDTYRFVQDGNAEYIRSNLVPTTFTDTHLSLLFLLNKRGRTVWGKGYDHGTGRHVAFPDFPASGLPPAHPLLQFRSSEDGVSGILMTGRGPLLVVSRPVLTSERRGPAQGTIIMGRIITPALVGTIARQARVDLRLWPARQDAVPPADRHMLGRLSTASSVLMEPAGEKMLRVYSLFPDFKGEPALLLRADVPRDILAQGAATIRYLEITTVVVGPVLVVVLLFLLQTIIVGPLSRLTAHATAVATTGDLSARLSMKRRDEIGILSRQFDFMVEQLAALRTQLLDQSFRAGQAEAAAGVLHNVRNALSPLVGRIDGCSDLLRDAPISTVERARAELARDDIAPARKEALARFQNLALERLAGMVKETSAQLLDIRHRIGEIEEILATQDKYARVERPVELLIVQDLVRDAVEMMPDSLRAAAHFHLDPSLAGIGPVWAQRSTLLQVFSNILNNAAESIRSQVTPEGCVRVSAEAEERDGAEWITVRFDDNGAGIAGEDLRRVFERGVSTKPNPSGLGLHWSANVVNAMGGRLSAESEGSGLGARLVVQLPRHPRGGGGAVRSSAL